jgi:hypothetical protein
LLDWLPSAIEKLIPGRQTTFILFAALLIEGVVDRDV